MSPKRKTARQLAPQSATLDRQLLGCGHAKTLATGVQYRGTSEDWDGVSEWQCHCGRRWGRWTGRELTGNEIESRYGGRSARQAGRKTPIVYGASGERSRLSKQGGD